jgi:hypothetical protein
MTASQRYRLAHIINELPTRLRLCWHILVRGHGVDGTYCITCSEDIAVELMRERKGPRPSGWGT